MAQDQPKMTDRYNVLTVFLERETRDDDAEQLINAIKSLRNVLDVKGVVSDYSDIMAESRAKRELISKLWEVLK